jgi:hypothetical protein
MRDLLMHHGVLPVADRHLLMFKNWLGAISPPSTTPGRASCSTSTRPGTSFASEVVPDSARQPIGSSRDRQARRKIVKASEFLRWLAARGHAPGECIQADLDAWHAEERIARRPAQEFLRWCMRTKAMPRLEILAVSTRNPHRSTSIAGSPCSGASSRTSSSR